MQQKIKRITPTTIIVGIDVVKEIHWARIKDRKMGYIEKLRMSEYKRD